jgi:hypothetical protein
MVRAGKLQSEVEQRPQGARILSLWDKTDHAPRKWSVYAPMLCG